ncbi:hypothetical protein A3D66_02800 [Candidatus Kaiserbacteria bacterium RIFCSPHIGHO2_02_FULL_50_9]|uniref:VanZ-like domain-containing protein n=1 Tax=Candidatus Kaiserbacteria bacterium RIFCSPLOWO2_01_FULL_51_21 TaxID=1798508 RepID=A0A1F6ECG2_9BACT|nr:MAG: hypothetical protein A2761_01180 [Candidatus Kaiserbacteria bacterium RIFCSPHIGHO2_01_FULL_51_33]OGG63345.1 MAG: hypothetical protein A3D66_02800 [Candidatus Kaiserbacteria bacterium RIFCSPHIGHO2_02_FULL_50_9]OGG71374.1 MAG: hypothetical protein A3A35_01335 [Candidatus Kaiserbacteria bacterium RIFCSPLOWO2_01_FULL_51_21]
MSQNRLLFAILGLVAIIAVLHFFATYYGLYWTVRWFDTPMHFLGGMMVALFVSWVGMRAGMLARMTSGKRRFFLIIGATAIVGVLWELFELSISLRQEPGYLFDTLQDLLFDIVGGAIGYYAIYFSVLKIKSRAI